MAVLNMERFFEKLSYELTPCYGVPHTTPGHDINHVLEMLQIGESIQTIYPELELDEFRTAVWLHNTDRAYPLQQEMRIRTNASWSGFQQRWTSFLRKKLQRSPFSVSAQHRIIHAVLHHGKRDDEQGDSVLLTAVRIADKVTRFGPLGIVAATAHTASERPAYNPNRPFVVESTAEGHMNTTMDALFRVLEWIPMVTERALTLEQLWTLIPSRRVASYIRFLRDLGEQISEVTGAENRIEDCIKDALSDTYDDVIKVC